MESIVTETFIKVGVWLTSKVADKGFDSLTSKLKNIDDTGSFNKIVIKTSKEVQQKYPEVLGGSIEYFFKHDEVFSELMNLLFIDAKINIDIIESYIDVSTLPEGFLLEFIKTLRRNLHKDPDLSVILGNKELYVACIGINNKLEDIKSVSSLTLTEIKRIKELLKDNLAAKFDEKDFLSKYYTSALNNLSQINFIGLGIDSSIRQRGRKKIQDIFVKPVFNIGEYEQANREKLIAKAGVNDLRNIPIEFLFTLNNHLVIIGNPGGGKSLLVKAIMCSLIQNSFLDFKKFDAKDLLPFRIELRKYLSYKKDKKLSLIEYISYMLMHEYSTPSISTDVVTQLITGKRTIVLFDGLDEIFDINDRVGVRNDIENFIANYNCAYSITTSRTIGYDEVALDSDKFFRVNVNKFTNAQIEDYVNKWYNIEEANKHIREREISEFMQKIDNVDFELVSNPLLLSLIVILYRNNLKLPESKLEIYKSCTSTLVDKWDSSKELEVTLNSEIYKRKETVLADLAYWQYNEQSKEDPKITYERAKQTIADTIQNKLGLADEFTSTSMAQTFMDYAEKRSIYFDNNFTHKTFLEYYTAFWIYTNIEKKHKKDERNSLIERYISNQYWHIVLELLLNFIDKDQADNEIMDELLQYQLDKSDDSLPFLISVLPSLSNISNTQVEVLFTKTINYIIKVSNPDKFPLKEKRRNREAQPKIRVLFKSLQLLIEKDKYFPAFTNSILSVNSSLKEDDQFVYCYFLLEMTMGVNKDLDLDKRLVNVINAYSILRKYYLISTGSNALNDNPIAELSSFVSTFSIEEAKKSNIAYYLFSHVFSLYHLTLRRLFYSSNIMNLAANIEELNLMGESFNEILLAMCNDQESLVWYDVNIRDVLNMINTTVENKLLAILSLYVVIYFEQKSRRDEISLDEIYGSIISDFVKDYIVQAFSLQNENSLAEHTLEYYSI